MKEIKLSKRGKHAGKYIALVDDEDYERVNQYNWNIKIDNNNFYTLRTLFDQRTKKYKTQFMHQFIFGDKKGFLIDHEDRNGLNNQKYNLRYCTKSENGKNRRACGKSNFLGVSWDKTKNTWKAQIKLKYNYKHLGYFITEEEAALAYNNAAKVHHKEFANLNNLM